MARKTIAELEKQLKDRESEISRQKRFTNEILEKLVTIGKISKQRKAHLENILFGSTSSGMITGLGAIAGGLSFNSAYIGASVGGALGTALLSFLGYHIAKNDDFSPKQGMLVTGASALVTALALSQAPKLAYNSGYAHAEDARVISFQHPQAGDGIVVEREDGTQTPYLLQENGTYLTLDRVEEKESAQLFNEKNNQSQNYDKKAEDIKIKYRDMEVSIFGSIPRRKKTPQDSQ